ncbi:MAG: antA/AntB antirepressor family protein [Nitrososphaerota archaeon]|nr:antA/AntB antirepressor family protein [Nitrososphaerota archaeon]
MSEAQGVQTPFHKWIERRIEECRFKQDVDFICVDKIVRAANVTGKQRVKEYHLTFEAGKHLAMMERNEIGKAVRDFSTWIKDRIEECRFKGGVDYVEFSPNLGKTPSG